MKVPRGGGSRRPNSSLQPASMNRLLNLLSRAARYLASGWAPGEVINTRSIMGRFMASWFMCQKIILFESMHTNREDEKADVVQPIRCLAGQLLYKAAEDGAEVALISTHRHLHSGRRLGVTVTARKHRSHFKYIHKLLI